MAGRGAARVRMLDDDGSGFFELENDARGSVEVEEVGERQFLALENLRGGVSGSVRL